MPQVTCITCNTQFDKYPNQIKKHPNHFCSRSCAAKYNGVAHPKRKLTNLCKICNGKIRSDRTYCTPCYTREVINADRRTLHDVVYDDTMKSNRYTYVRYLARKTMLLANVERVCRNCGYDKHVECCHIRPICDFPIEARVYEINTLTNLIYLCPNCHWEYDKGLIDVNKVGGPAKN